MMQNERLTDHLTEGKRLLLVENSDLNQEIVAALLSYTGAVVEGAADGQEAVARFAGAEPGTYHMILLELQLPVMSGFETARAIRNLKRPDAGQIPILGLTGNLSPETLEEAARAGFNECLGTPLDRVRLMEVMERYGRGRVHGRI